MKLLPKTAIQDQRAVDQKLSIDEGLKLARKVDELRELRSKEEARLRQFKEESIKNAQEEIDKAILRKETFVREADEAEEKAIRLANDPELLEVRRRLKERSEEQESIGMDQLTREITVTKRENDTKDKEDSFFLREKTVSLAEGQAAKLRKDAETAASAAQDALRAAEAAKAREEGKEQEHTLLRRQKDSELRSAAKDLALREKKLEQDKEDIINEKKFLADQRQTLERGFAELRRKQHHG